jgi:tRNA G10  N-methylase Trm11
MKIKHPAVFTDAFIPIFAELLNRYKCQNVLDCMAGTGKIALVKKYWKGKVYCVDLEEEWALPEYPVDYWFTGDAAHTIFKDGQFDAIITSPSYGNRLADHQEAKDPSYRITYTHRLGRQLHPENTGKMQWGITYRFKHREIYHECKRILKDGGLLVINISNHIRNWKEIDVVGWTRDALIHEGFTLIEERHVETPRMRYGANANLRVATEAILIFQKVPLDTASQK